MTGSEISAEWQAGLLDAQDLDAMNIPMGITEPCLPPCWQNLIPGESRAEEVLQILEGLKFIDRDSIEYFASDDNPISVVTWNSSLVDNSIYEGRARIMEDRLIFLEIVLEYELTVQEIMNQLGEPSLYEIVPYGPESSASVVRFMWPTHGFVASLPEYPPRTVIAPDLLVKRLAYFVPGDDAANYLEGRGSSAEFADLFMPWKGFEDLNVP